MPATCRIGRFWLEWPHPDRGRTGFHCLRLVGDTLPVVALHYTCEDDNEVIRADLGGR